MPTTKQSPFQQALDAVETLPADQQQDLVAVLQKRLAESRRREIAANIRQAKAEHRQGKTKKGTIEDLMRDLHA